MPLIPYADPEKMPEETRTMFDKVQMKINIFRMWSNAYSCFAPGVRFGNAILSKQKLDPALRELVILAVARIEAGIYEWVQHIPIGKRAGCREDQIAALAAGDFSSKAFDDRERAMLKLVFEAVRDVRASEAAVEAAKRHFDAQEIVEIILTTGFYMTMARMTETTRVDIDAPAGVAIPDFEKIR